MTNDNKNVDLPDVLNCNDVLNGNQNNNRQDTLNNINNSNPIIQNNNLSNLVLPKNKFNIGHINLQGMSSKFDELKLMLTSPDNNIAIMGISETKFNLNHKMKLLLLMVIKYHSGAIVHKIGAVVWQYSLNKALIVSEG